MERISTVEKKAVWSEILGDIRQRIGEQRFNLWIGHTELVSLTHTALEVGVPNLFVQEWLEGHFRDLFQEVCNFHLDHHPQVRFVISGRLYQESRKKAIEADEDIIVDGAKRSIDHVKDRINDEFRLANFVVGSCNKLAHACAAELIDGAGSRFNPLFFHSASGMGKTHLLQSIWWGIRDAADGRRTEYIAAEEFTNQFIYAMRNGKLDAFRHKYRNVDVLFIDDVHFFCDKMGLQEEFLHTYDVLESDNKQIVLASDVHPKMLRRLKESLLSRFASGMVVRLSRPDFSTRVEILRRKAKQLRRRISEEVLRYIARGFEGNVRELIGALTTIVAYASLTRHKISMGLAREAITELAEKPSHGVDMESIEKAVTLQFGVTRQDLHSGRRTKAIALPRQVCMFLARELTQLSCAEIAAHFGGKHHTTVVFGQRRVAELCQADRDLADTVAALRDRVLGH